MQPKSVMVSRPLFSRIMSYATYETAHDYFKARLESIDAQTRLSLLQNDLSDLVQIPLD